MKITVVGMGYVGLSNSILLAIKNEVVGIELDDNKRQMINNKISPLKDKEIEEYLSNKKLDFIVKKEAKEDYKDSDVIIIAVPTNYDENKDFFDTSIVEDVLDDISISKTDATIIIKSTIPIGFTEQMRKKYDNKNIIFSPEFLREGRALYDSLYPSRIIIGDKNQRAKNVAKMYEDVILNEPKVLFMHSTEAEAVKLFANTYLALRVSYFNELDSYASTFNLDTKDIIEGVCADSRIGDMYNNPSFGYGGYCLPKDTKQLLSNFKQVPNDIIKAVVSANDTRKEFITKEILQKNPKIVGVYRLTMKAGSDNFRKSAVFDIIEKLKKENVEIIVYEPTIKQDNYMGLKVVDDFEVFKKSDIIIANRFDKELESLKDKLYTKDIFLRD
ncbi:MAG: nucleotide sugar dehydrogenase [Tissierellia bacterium]|nr:nucleotide sugar dehydrogenase [Tissierellia bacterium]